MRPSEPPMGPTAADLRAIRERYSGIKSAPAPGSSEEVDAAIDEYFNNPNLTLIRARLASDMKRLFATHCAQAGAVELTLEELWKAIQDTKDVCGNLRLWLLLDALNALLKSRVKGEG